MRIHLVTDEGELIETIDLNEYDLSKPLVRTMLVEDIKREVEIERRAMAVKKVQDEHEGRTR